MQPKKFLLVFAIPALLAILIARMVTDAKWITITFSPWVFIIDGTLVVGEFL